MMESLPIDLSKSRKEEFQSALKCVKHLEQIVYHQGSFCAGPHRKEAMTANEKGYVCLVQKKVGPANFKYIAIRTSKKMRAN